GGQNYYLGRDNYTANPQSMLDGQLDEVRLWSVTRTEEEIRSTMFRALTGAEPGLAGLWNFDDPNLPARDATTNSHHGEFLGGARTIAVERPSSTDVKPPTLFEGSVRDSEGSPVTGASVIVTGLDYFSQERAAPKLPAWSSVGTTDASGS